MAAGLEGLAAREGRQLEFGGRYPTVRAIACDRSERDRQMLVLEIDDRAQVLGDCVERPELIWAGDVDGDDKLDLLTTSGLSDGYREELFVSSWAGDRLVRRVAAFGGMAD